jgi:hypothetical protein
MKKVFMFSALSLVVLLAIGPALAQDEGGSTPVLRVRPSLSIGYIGDVDNTTYSLNSATGNIGGVSERKYMYQNFSQLYLEGVLAVDIGRRFSTEIITAWALPVHDEYVREDDLGAGALLGGRTWKVYTLWSALEGNVSYDLIGDPSVPFSFKPKVGVRWDYWSMSYDEPFAVSPGFAVASPADTAEFYSSAVLPFGGFTASYSGFRRGMWGGDLVVEAEGGPLAWGKARHKETRDLGGVRHDVFEGGLDRGYFYEVSINYNVLTLDFSPKVQGTVGLFGKLSGFHVEGDLDGSRNGVELAEFRFIMDRSLYMAGITMGVTFDIFGKPTAVPPAPAPAPVIEPKLEPMSKN